MKEFIHQNRIFLSLYLLFLITGGILIATVERGNEILYISSLHNSFADQLFKWLTYLAEWPIVVFLLLITIRMSYGKELVMLLNILLVFAAIQFCKYELFPNEARPSVFFEGRQGLNFVPGVQMMHSHSFPSGHTATAFGFLFMLSILTEDKRWSILFFTVALLVGISRVYLLQHFFRDIYAGSLLAVVVTSFFYLTFVRSSFYQKLSWKDKSLFNYD